MTRNDIIGYDLNRKLAKTIDESDSIVAKSANEWTCIFTVKCDGTKYGIDWKNNCYTVQRNLATDVGEVHTADAVVSLIKGDSR